MSLITHRAKEDLGGLVYLLTIDMRDVTEDPTHVLRLVNNYGENGEGVTFQTNKYTPYPYELKQVKRSASSNTNNAKISLSDNEGLTISRFIDKVGGDLQGAKVTELKVYGVFLDTSPDANPLAYVKRLDHIVDYVEDSDTIGEVVLNTVDPLSKDVDVPTISFTAGLPNGSVSAINIFPAVNRNISQERG
mgnify:FL=1